MSKIKIEAAHANFAAYIDNLMRDLGDPSPEEVVTTRQRIHAIIPEQDAPRRVCPSRHRPQMSSSAREAVLSAKNKPSGLNRKAPKKFTCQPSFDADSAPDTAVHPDAPVKRGESPSVRQRIREDEQRALANVRREKIVFHFGLGPSAGFKSNESRGGRSDDKTRPNGSEDPTRPNA